MGKADRGLKVRKGEKIGSFEIKDYFRGFSGKLLF